MIQSSRMCADLNRLTTQRVKDELSLTVRYVRQNLLNYLGKTGKRMTIFVNHVDISSRNDLSLSLTITIPIEK